MGPEKGETWSLQRLRASLGVRALGLGFKGLGIRAGGFRG